jgi:hypothetical protein
MVNNEGVIILANNDKKVTITIPREYLTDLIDILNEYEVMISDYADSSCMLGSSDYDYYTAKARLSRIIHEELLK